MKELNYYDLEGSMIILSDFHLGDGSPSDDFGNNDDAMLAHIDYLYPDWILLIGDIHDLWQHSRKSIKKAHPKLYEFILTDPRVIFVEGNHDATAFGLSLFPFCLNGVCFVATHGHQGNMKFMTNPLIKLGVFLFSFIEKLFTKHASILEKRFNKRSNIEAETLDYARHVLAKYDCEVVILGHSHQDASISLEGRYLNVGCCTDGIFQDAFIDESGRLQIHKINANHYK